MRRHRVACILAAAFVLVGGLGGGFAEAHREASKQAPALKLRLVFHRLDKTGVGALLSDGRYVFVSDLSQNWGGTLIDSATGRRKSVSAPYCRPDAIGAPWLMFDCDTADNTRVLKLDDFETGDWRTITPSPNTEYGQCNSGGGEYPCGDATSVGVSWIRFTVGCYRCGAQAVYQNINTGEVRYAPTEATTTVDLDSPSLTRTACPPLHRPRAYDEFAGWGLGNLSFYGRFAIAEGTDAGGTPIDQLEHCGSATARLLVKGLYPYDPPVLGADNRAVIWQTAPGTLTGLSLPALRRLTIGLPAGAVQSGCSAPDFRTCLSNIVVTPRTLYVLTAPGELWAARLPATPESSRSRLESTSRAWIPASGRVLEISWSHGGRHRIVVTDPAKVRRVARAVNALPVNGPGVCAEGFVPPGITFSFRTARHGPVVARVAGVLNGSPDAFCEPTLLQVRGHADAWLIEDSPLLRQASHVLGIRLS